MPASEWTGGLRGTAPVVGVLVLIGLTVVAAAAVGAGAVSLSPASPPPTASFDVSVEASTDTFAITHQGGDEVEIGAIELVIEIGGERLREQPPVPFFSARGFESGPTGPFNTASGDRWRAGETGTFALASTNAPQLDDGDTVTIRITTGDVTIATLTETAT